MDLSAFYTKILATFCQNNVQYLLVGGHAVNYHGVIRATLDLDLWVGKTPENLKNLYQALIDLEYDVRKCKQAIHYFKTNHKFNIIRDNILIEILDSFILQYNFEKAFRNKKIYTFNEISIFIIGYQDLIEVKAKSNRQKDINDLHELKKLEKLNDIEKDGFSLE